MSENTIGGEILPPQGPEHREPDKKDNFERCLADWKNLLTESDLYNPKKMTEKSLTFSDEVKDRLEDRDFGLFEFGAIFFRTTMEMNSLYQEMDNIKAKDISENEKKDLLKPLLRKVKELSVNAQQDAVELLMFNQRDDREKMDLEHTSAFMTSLERILRGYKDQTESKSGGVYGFFCGMRGMLAAVVLAEAAGWRVNLPTKERDKYDDVDLEFITMEGVKGTMQVKSRKKGGDGKPLGFTVQPRELNQTMSKEYKEEHVINLHINIPNIDNENERLVPVYSLQAERALGTPTAASLEDFKNKVESFKQSEDEVK